MAEDGLNNDLCVSNTGAYLNGIAQIGFQTAGNDATGALGRTLTHGMIRYHITNMNENARTTPDGLWLLFPAYNFTGAQFQVLSGKMPPYPPVDSINRTTFVPIVVQLKPPGGIGVDNAVIRFGYAENGAFDQFYCTSRHEACVAVAANVPADPFKFPSDSPAGTLAGLAGIPCAAGCAVAIPALSQRVVYYQVLYRDSNNSVVAQARPQAAPTP